MGSVEILDQIPQDHNHNCIFHSHHLIQENHCFLARFNFCLLSKLIEYIKNRQVMLDRIAAFYGVSSAKCKYAVLRVMNGGSLMAWIRDAHCTRNQKPCRPLLASALA